MAFGKGRLDIKSLHNRQEDLVGHQYLPILGSSNTELWKVVKDTMFSVNT